MFYDPLGLVSPVVLQSILIYQSLCKEKINWDTIVPESIRNVRDKFVETLRHSEKKVISRSLFNIYDESCSYMDLQMRHPKPTVVLFTCDASWITQIQRHYCAPKVV